METRISIRRARPDEHALLTEISLSSKRYWNDPEEYFGVWKDELTITRSYIENNTVFAAEVSDAVVGYLSIVHVPQDFKAGAAFVQRGYWLEHLFVRPGFMRCGIGSRLISFARVWCAQNGIDRLLIFSDPHACGFYERLGAVYIGESASSIPGRTVPMMELIICA
jgi:GNAT superfamily N-acetyltransferase